MRARRGRLARLAAVVATLVLAAPAAAEPGPTWDWQLTAPFDLSRRVAWYDLDPDNHTRAQIQALVARGVTPICYVSVGTLENYRDDVADFPRSVIGKVYDDWPDERFLDIRKRAVLLPLMRARFERCKAMGFKAIEPDNQDVHINDSGFPITAADSVAYISALADMAHRMGMQIGQKNVPELTPRLVDKMDFVITEGCFDDGWCGRVMPYRRAGKPVFAAEYTDTRVDFAAACAWGKARGFSFILKRRDLDSALRVCR